MQDESTPPLLKILIFILSGYCVISGDIRNDIVDFLLMASYAWLVLSSWNGSIKWLFTYAMLGLLLNPYTNLEIRTDFWYTIYAISGLLMLISLLEDMTILKEGWFGRVINEVLIPKTKLTLHWINRRLGFLLVITILLGVTTVAVRNQNINYQKIKQKTEDSIKVANAIEAERLAAKEKVIVEEQVVAEEYIVPTPKCDSKIATTEIRKYIKFYNPEYKIKSTLNIKEQSTSDQCKFEISTQVEGGLGLETLIVEVRFSRYNQNRVSLRFIRKPIGFFVDHSKAIFH